MSAQFKPEPMGTPLSGALYEELAESARAAETAMRGSLLSAQWPDRDIDVLFASYLCGMILAALPDASGQDCVACLRNIGSEVLPADAIELALHRPSAGPESSFARMAKTIEAAGARVGLGLRASFVAAASSPLSPGPNGAPYDFPAFGSEKAPVQTPFGGDLMPRILSAFHPEFCPMTGARAATATSDRSFP